MIYILPNQVKEHLNNKKQGIQNDRNAVCYSWNVICRCGLRICTGTPYVKKLMVNVRKTAPLNKTFVCLTPDLQITTLSIIDPKRRCNL